MSPALSLRLHRLLRVLKSCTTKSPVRIFQLSASSSCDTPRTEVLLESRQFSAPQIAPRTEVVLQSPQSCRGLRRTNTNRTLTCISRTRHARSPQRVVPDWDKSHSRLHFAHSTRTISAEGCPGPGQIALAPAFRARTNLESIASPWFPICPCVARARRFRARRAMRHATALQFDGEEWTSSDSCFSFIPGYPLDRLGHVIWSFMRSACDEVIFLLDWRLRSF